MPRYNDNQGVRQLLCSSRVEYPPSGQMHRGPGLLYPKVLWNALWVLARDVHKTGNCSDHEDLARGTDRSLHSTDNLEGVATEDPLEAVLREKANAFKEKIRMHLAWCCASSTSRYYGERLEAIYAYVRRAVYKSLTFLSHSYDSVMALLTPSDQVLDLITMEKL
ncbi:hypothetical protein JVT61DRAFT_8292 [Boletus reticuloceps]|uniref:Uncharacterized protein n=1 Tax=Boletus reticuloceps TaxID=495285 RepID=A0A8I2YXC8_9AGAM|nr:hypothetical protein JVT61DRAFT_8292 [Boletus reticuloceps]